MMHDDGHQSSMNSKDVITAAAAAAAPNDDGSHDDEGFSDPSEPHNKSFNTGDHDHEQSLPSSGSGSGSTSDEMKMDDHHLINLSVAYLKRIGGASSSSSGGDSMISSSESVQSKLTRSVRVTSRNFKKRRSSNRCASFLATLFDQDEEGCCYCCCCCFSPLQCIQSWQSKFYQHPLFYRLSLQMRENFFFPRARRRASDPTFEQPQPPPGINIRSRSTRSFFRKVHYKSLMMGMILALIIVNWSNSSRAVMWNNNGESLYGTFAPAVPVEDESLQQSSDWQQMQMHQQSVLEPLVYYTNVEKRDEEEMIPLKLQREKSAADRIESYLRGHPTFIIPSEGADTNHLALDPSINNVAMRAVELEQMQQQEEVQEEQGKSDQAVWVEEVRDKAEEEAAQHQQQLNTELAWQQEQVLREEQLQHQQQQVQQHHEQPPQPETVQDKAEEVAQQQLNTELAWQQEQVQREEQQQQQAQQPHEQPPQPPQPETVQDKAEEEAQQQLNTELAWQQEQLQREEQLQQQQVQVQQPQEQPPQPETVQDKVEEEAAQHQQQLNTELARQQEQLQREEEQLQQVQQQQEQPPQPETYTVEFNNIKNTWDPHERNDIALLWHVPASGSSVIRHAVGGCHRLVQASGFGLRDGHTADEQVGVFYPTEGSPFVNIDSTTITGIRQAASMRFADAQVADVVVSPLIYGTNELFTQTSKGRFFAVFSHPVDRAVRLFYSMKEVQPALREWTIERYSRSTYVENNFLTRQLSKQLEGPLEESHYRKAVEIVRDKFLVGLTTKMDESLGRFEKYFRWTYRIHPESQESCRSRILSEDLAAEEKLKQRMPKEDDPNWAWLLHHNAFDLRLYAYIEKLFEEQAVFVKGAAENFRNIDTTCCRCEPATFPAFELDGSDDDEITPDPDENMSSEEANQSTFEGGIRLLRRLPPELASALFVPCTVDDFWLND